MALKKRKVARRSRSKGRKSREGMKSSPQPSFSYSVPPKTTFQTKSIRIPLSRKSQPVPELPFVQAPDREARMQHAGTMVVPPKRMHYYSSLVFLAASIWGLVFALKFASEKNWLLFLISIITFLVGVDNVVVSLHKASAQQNNLPYTDVIRVHRFSAHIFFLLALLGMVFGVTFWLQGKWIMLLLSAAVVIIGLDSMYHAKRNHRAA